METKTNRKDGQYFKLPDGVLPENAVQYTITLQHRRVGCCAIEYRWRRNDGEWVSPPFSTVQAAISFSKNEQFRSDKEWREAPMGNATSVKMSKPTETFTNVSQ